MSLGFVAMSLFIVDSKSSGTKDHLISLKDCFLVALALLFKKHALAISNIYREIVAAFYYVSTFQPVLEKTVACHTADNNQGYDQSHPQCKAIFQLWI